MRSKFRPVYDELPEGARPFWRYRTRDTGVGRGPVVGSEPPEDIKEGCELFEFLRTREQWYVHRSREAMLAFIADRIGVENIHFEQYNGKSSCRLVVPPEDAPFWIGKEGSMVGLLKRILKVEDVFIDDGRKWR
jgi:hypothetical protein